MNEQGRVVDMHSLRHGYVTTLVKAGVPVKTLQTLARYSDPKLTLNVYSHLTLFDTAAALDALPDLSRGNPTPEAARMTGTGPVARRMSERFSHHLPTARDGRGRGESDSDATGDSHPVLAVDRKSLPGAELDGSWREPSAEVGRVPSWTRIELSVSIRLPR